MTTIANRITRYTAAALVAAGLAIGGSLGTSAIGQADPGRIADHDVRTTTKLEGRAPISHSSQLTDSALNNARGLQNHRFNMGNPAINE